MYMNSEHWAKTIYLICIDAAAQYFRYNAYSSAFRIILHHNVGFPLSLPHYVCDGMSAQILKACLFQCAQGMYAHLF